MMSQYSHGFPSKKIGDLFVLNSYIDKLYIKMLEKKLEITMKMT